MFHGCTASTCRQMHETGCTMACLTMHFCIQRRIEVDADRKAGARRRLWTKQVGKAKGPRKTAKSKQLRIFSNVEGTMSLVLASCKINLVSPAPEEDSLATSEISQPTQRPGPDVVNVSSFPPANQSAPFVGTIIPNFPSTSRKGNTWFLDPGRLTTLSTHNARWWAASSLTLRRSPAFSRPPLPGALSSPGGSISSLCFSRESRYRVVGHGLGGCTIAPWLVSDGAISESPRSRAHMDTCPFCAAGQV